MGSAGSAPCRSIQSGSVADRSFSRTPTPPPPPPAAWLAITPLRRIFGKKDFVNAGRSCFDIYFFRNLPANVFHHSSPILPRPRNPQFLGDPLEPQPVLEWFDLRLKAFQLDLLLGSCREVFHGFYGLRFSCIFATLCRCPFAWIAAFAGP